MEKSTYVRSVNEVKWQFVEKARLLQIRTYPSRIKILTYYIFSESYDLKVTII